MSFKTRRKLRRLRWVFTSFFFVAVVTVILPFLGAKRLVHKLNLDVVLRKVFNNKPFAFGFVQFRAVVTRV